MLFIFLMIMAIAFIGAGVVYWSFTDEDYNGIYSVSGFLMYLGFIVGCLDLILFAFFGFF